MLLSRATGVATLGRFGSVLVTPAPTPVTETGGHLAGGSALESVSLTVSEDLLSFALGPQLASPLVGSFVALRDLFTVLVEGRGRGGPSRSWLLGLLGHD